MKQSSHVDVLIQVESRKVKVQKEAGTIKNGTTIKTLTLAWQDLLFHEDGNEEKPLNFPQIIALVSRYYISIFLLKNQKCLFDFSHFSLIDVETTPCVYWGNS